MDLRLYDIDALRPFQLSENGYNWAVGLIKSPDIRFVPFRYSFQREVNPQETILNFELRKISISGDVVTQVGDATVLTPGDINVESTDNSFTYMLKPNVLTNTITCGIYQYYIKNKRTGSERNTEFLSDPFYITGEGSEGDFGPQTAGDFGDDFFN